MQCRNPLRENTVWFHLGVGDGCHVSDRKCFNRRIWEINRSFRNRRSQSANIFHMESYENMKQWCVEETISNSVRPKCKGENGRMPDWASRQRLGHVALQPDERIWLYPIGSEKPNGLKEGSGQFYILYSSNTTLVVVRIWRD